ncbi:hypothetical protein PybrP1_005534 [[Pythium] brassicae (nom. inval.)]|nr:hypothetical protein PybrP1_005534 [[Pythium] brassicae (nom. inval.)]
MALSTIIARVAAARSTAPLRAAFVRAQWRAASSASDGGSSSTPENADAPKKKSEDGELYDPYKLYQEASGSRGYREFNPDLYEGENLNFTWTESEELMADKSWPATTGTDLFADLVNVSDTVPTGEKLELILAEAFKRMGHKGINDIKLPEIDVAIPAEHPDRDALEIMKLSLLNNGRISLDDKNEIMKSIVDEIDHVRKDKTKLFKDLD